MSVIPEELKTKMMWILFWVFIPLFVLIVFATLLALFFDFGSLTDTERDRLFYVFIVEIGLAVTALFYSLFGLKEKDSNNQTRIRLNPENDADIRKLLGKKVVMSPSKIDGSGLDDIETLVHDDNGPYIPLDVPDDAYSVYFTISLNDTKYTGSFVVGSYFVDISKE